MVEVAEEIEALLGAVVAQEVDLEAVETALRRKVLRVAARQLQECLNADHSDLPAPRERVPAASRPGRWNGEPSASRAC